MRKEKLEFFLSHSFLFFLCFQAGCSKPHYYTTSLLQRCQQPALFQRHLNTTQLRHLVPCSVAPAAVRRLSNAGGNSCRRHPMYTDPKASPPPVLPPLAPNLSLVTSQDVEILPTDVHHVSVVELR